jgi:hypothetical protein
MCIMDNVCSAPVAENGESDMYTRLSFIYNYVCLLFPTSNDFLFHLETGVIRVIEEKTRNDDVVLADSIGLAVY